MGEKLGLHPLTDKELLYLSNNLKPVVVPDLTVIAEKNAEPVGFMEYCRTSILS